MDYFFLISKWITNFFESKGTDRQHLLNVIGEIPYIERATYTDEALKKANEQVLVESNGMRPVSDGVPKIVMVITGNIK